MAGQARDLSFQAQYFSMFILVYVPSKYYLAKFQSGKKIIPDTLMSILSGVSLRMFQMDIALTLRESMFINGVLTNSESWYNMKEEHFKILEMKDNELMRKVFDAHSKTACELFWLESGKISIRYIVSKRRLMYLWTILKQKDDQLIRKTYNAQQLKPTRGDWYKMVQDEKSKYSINLTDQQISQMSRYKFKKMVDKNVGSYAFEYLKVKASSHSKSLDILAGVQTQLVAKRKAYLKENTLTRDDCHLLFKLRSRMLDVKVNFSNQYDDIVRLCILRSEKTDNGFRSLKSNLKKKFQ